MTDTEHTDIRWEATLREGSQIFLEGTSPNGRIYLWMWDFRSMFEGPTFLNVNGGPLDPGEVPPRPSAEAMAAAEQIQHRLENGDPTQEWPRMEP